jgi:hypothetical protein
MSPLEHFRLLLDILAYVSSQNFHIRLVDTKNYNQEKIEALLSDFRRKYAGLSFVGWHWGLLEKWIGCNLF